MLCRYSESLGKPGEGVHSPRLGGFAIMDVLFTVALAALLTRRFGWSFRPTLLCSFAAGIVAHRIFCVHTALDRLLFE